VWLSTFARIADQPGVEELLVSDLEGISGDYQIEDVDIILLKISLPIKVGIGPRKEYENAEEFIGPKRPA
jgi:hypothetical protein